MFPSGVCRNVLWTMNGVRSSPISSRRTAEQGALTARGAACPPFAARRCQNCVFYEFVSNIAHECLATLRKIVWSADAKGPDHRVVPGYVDRLRLTLYKEYPYPTTHQAAFEIVEFN
ncbi:hypothetical protein IFM47457_01341 [Aspergillus lentulus]|nr:hypothetical protein IFM47457_01341 [Aspergillus lentulus]